MARLTSRHPTELELDSLKVLWRDGSLTGRDVRDRLAETRELAYTSVMTVIRIMQEKGYQKRKKSGKTFIYSPRVTEAATKKRMLRDVVDRVYEGATMSVVVNLLESIDDDADELKHLRALLPSEFDAVPPNPFPMRLIGHDDFRIPGPEASPVQQRWDKNPTTRFRQSTR